MRRLVVPLLVALVAAGPAAADRIVAKQAGSRLVGTPRSDVLVGRRGPDLVDAAFGGRDRVTCGSGRDVVSADVRDRVAADCEVVSRRLSVDTSTNPRSQHETAVEPDDFAWGSTVVAAYQLGRYEQGAASNIGAAVSTDAGRTWRRTVLPGITLESSPPGTEISASDPTVAYDAAHGVWLVGSLTLETGSSHVLVSRSQDGLHWSLPVVVATGPVLDKDWFACDNNAASPHRGRCYATYTDDVKNWTVVQHSDDGGATWSTPVRAAGTLVGTQPVIRPDGGLVVVAGSYNGEQALTGSIASLVSTDGGETFTRSIVSTLTARSNEPLRSIALPSADVDGAGTLYAAWHDCRFRSGCSGNDLVLSTSTDGVLWKPPVRIPLKAGKRAVQAFLPGLVADPTQAGHLGLVYAFWRPGTCPHACLLEVAFVSSANGGRSWSVPQELSPRPLPMSWLARSEGGRMVGDYLSTAYADGRFVPVFALAEPPRDERLREAIFAASLPAVPRPPRG
ncbi:MAG TPA: sialidase family protein [Gaiellaceae bacterium]|nr:sialidase family protein [Gaiellaceae bacterium]